MRVERDFPGHFVGAPDCRFFRTTDVNGWRVSTVGDYRPRGDKQRGEPTMIGWQRYYETMVFRLGDTPCGCGCGAMEVASWSEQDMDGYDTEAAAANGHELMVEKYAAITPPRRPPMPEPTLTAEEKDKLEAAWQTWNATGYHRESPWGVVVADFVRLALAAVPRLALASPMVGEMVEKAWREGYDTGSDPAWCNKQLRRAGVYAEAHEPAATEHFWNDSEAKRSLAALTGEEGRDGL